jgi:hypothetical protein
MTDCVAIPIQTDTFTCGECGRPVETKWSSAGLMPGPYSLFGDVFFHEPECADVYLKAFKNALDKEQENTHD